MHQTITAAVESLAMPGAVPVPLLYGGSVDRSNAGDILSIDAVDGLLVGKASLAAESFLPIVRAAAGRSIAPVDVGY